MVNPARVNASGSRRDDLLDAVTDHVLEHGLIGLTLRPVAAAVGTSDRMLVYHFGTRDGLVSAVVAASTARSVAALNELPATDGVQLAVERLWTAYLREPLAAGHRLYIQAAATGLIGREPWRTITRESNASWTRALRDYLVRSGAPTRRAARIVTLVDSSLMGFQLDLATDNADELARGVKDLAAAAAALAG